MLHGVEINEAKVRPKFYVECESERGVLLSIELLLMKLARRAIEMPFEQAWQTQGFREVSDDILSGEYLSSSRWNLEI